MHRLFVHLVGKRAVIAWQQVGQTVGVVIVEWSVDARVTDVCVHRLLNLLISDIGDLRQLLRRWLALMFLLEFLYLVVDLRQGTHLIERQTYHAALLGNGLQNALTNPPHGIADELKTTRLVKFLSGLYKPDITLIYQIGQR